MPNVTLAKALKLKNRRVQRVKDLTDQIQKSNSYLAGSEPDFDARDLLQQLKDETGRLWRLKAAINRANAPIQDAIYEMAELKGRIAFLRTLNTLRGRAVQPYMMQEPQEYEAQITAAEAQIEIRAAEERIDDLQDQMDAHNATVTIDVED